MSNLFQELKRRKVVRVAGVYAVVAWVLIQVADSVVPALQLPAWTTSLIVVLLLICFPIALMLAWAFELAPTGMQPQASALSATVTNSTIDRKFIYATFALVLLVAMFQIGERLFFSAPSPNTNPAATSGTGSAQVMRFTVPISNDRSRLLGSRLDTGWGRPASTSLALSPDGSLLVYAAWESGADNSMTSRLYLRGLDQFQAEAMAGTEDGATPFFSPDGQWIGYFAGASLRRVAITGGESQTIVADAGLVRGLVYSQPQQFAYGASWGDDDTIVYGGADGLYRVAAQGGQPQLIVPRTSGAGEFTRLAQPQMLPGSKSVLLHATVAEDPSTAQLMLLDLDTGSLTMLLEDAMNPLLLDSGQLLFLRRGVLMSVPLDIAEAAITGEPVVVLDDVMQTLNTPRIFFNTGAGLITVSRSGHLAYAAGGLYPDRRDEVVRVQLDGTEEALGLELRGYRTVVVSPDGSRLLTRSTTAEGATLLIHDLARGVSSLLDVGGFSNSPPRFSPDGLSIVFGSDRGNIPLSVHRMPLDGSLPPERLVFRDVQALPSSWSSTGVIAYVEDQHDIWMLPPDGEPAPFLTTDAIETHPSFSPDGQWVAYVSDATGRQEVYVRPYPGPGAALQISGNGGNEPAWSPDGRRLYYNTPGAQETRLLKFVDITIDTDRVASPMQAGREAVLIESWPYAGTTPTRSFDVAPDGSFLVVKSGDPDTANPGETSDAMYRRLSAVSELQIVLNFAEELRVRQAAVAQ